MPLTVLVSVGGLLLLLVIPPIFPQPHHHQNITRRSDRRYYDGAIYIHPPHNSNPYRQKGRNEGRSMNSMFNPFSQSSPSRQSSFSYCSAGG
ncbi:hypothetical protein X975_17388, partial [Stegodyphus mimosarum]